MKKLTVRDIREIELQLNSETNKEAVNNLKDKIGQIACSFVIQIVNSKGMSVRDAYNHCKDKYVAAYGYHWTELYRQANKL